MSNCVHCNFCGLFPSPECTAFCLSNCGHIFCKNCVDTGRLSVKCNRCGAAAPKFIPIDRNLKPDLQMFFKKPSAILAEQMAVRQPLLKFQSSQRALRLKGQAARIAHERGRRTNMESQMKTIHEQLKIMRPCNENSRSRHSSREDSRSLSRGGDVSDLSHHHTMSSTVSSNDSHYSNPFKTPVNGLKRFTTSTPKAPMEGPRPKKHAENSMHSRLSNSSTLPSLTSFSMEVDDDEIIDVTPAPIKARQGMQQQLQQTQSTTMSKSCSSMEIDYDPILPSGALRTPLPKTPAPKKNPQGLSMAERLSSSLRPPTAKTPQKALQQPEVTSTTTPNATSSAIPAPKTPAATQKVPSGLVKAKAPVPITPIRPINVSQMPSSTTVLSANKTEMPSVSSSSATPAAASAKKSDRPSASSSAAAAAAFKTPMLPVKKIAPRTMPAGMKTGVGGRVSGVGTPLAAAAAHLNISHPQL